MRAKRTLSTLAATLLGAAVVSTAYSPAADAFSIVNCTFNSTGSLNWLNCDSSSGTNTIWYVNGVHQSAFDGDSTASFFCTYGQTYQISVNTGMPSRGSWFGYCDYQQA